MSQSAHGLSPAAITRTVCRVDDDVDVSTSLLGAAAPLVFTPVKPGVDLAEWAARHRSSIDRLLLDARALLFRGFGVESAAAFHAFVSATSSGPLLEYKDRSTPRYEVSPGVYISTIYPAEHRINPHNEGTYWQRWPLKLYFCCLIPAASGGETPITDVRRVFDRIDSGLRDAFRERQVMYVRNYNPGIGLTWQDAFQTDDPQSVEEYAAANGITTEWTSAGRLRTRQIRPAIRLHPSTGEPVWFNHAAFFHVSSLDPEVQEALLSSYGEDGLPYNTYFGDGGTIDAAVVAHIRAAYAAETITFRWQAGDVLLLDNMTFAHGREPYEGNRHVVVAMTEAHSGVSADRGPGTE